MKFEIPLSDALFREKIQRDLQSLIDDPLILNDPGALSLQAFMRDSVKHFLAKDPERLWRMIARPEPRLPLGKWFERIFLAALRVSFPFADIRHSVSDQKGGELDFVMIHERRTTHIECSVKFFLYHAEQGSGLSSFIGPGGQDRLDLKFHKMRDVQLKRNIPDELVGRGDTDRVLWMSGRIHNPILMDVSGFPDPGPDFNPNHLRGYWGTKDDVFAALAPEDLLIRIPRQWWMTRLGGLSRDALKVFETVDQTDAIEEPIMTAHIAFMGAQALEISRGFIVPTKGPGEP